MPVVIEPMNDRILVRPIEDKLSMTKGGIEVPDIAKAPPTKGMVVAVGRGHFNASTGEIHPLHIKVGDMIYFHALAGIQMEVDEVDHLMLREGEVLGVERDR